MLSAEAAVRPSDARFSRHPVMSPQLIVSMTLGLGGIIPTGQRWGIGHGLPAEYATWGNMINAAANNTALVYYPNLWMAPGICIVLAVRIQLLERRPAGRSLTKARRYVMVDKQNTYYISAKESRDIARSNCREIRYLWLRKTYRRADFKCHADEGSPNVVEFDDLHTYFFTDNGVVKAVNACPSTFRRARRSALWVSPVAANP